MKQKLPLKSVAEIIMGTSPPSSTYNHSGEGLPLLNGPTEFGEISPNCTLYTTDSKKECRKGDILFCVRASTGRMNWADQRYSIGRGICAIRGHTQKDTKYIRYCLDYYLEYLLQLATGGTFTNLKKTTIENFEIPWSDVRFKIVDILSNFDALHEVNLNRIGILEEIVQSLYNEWFVKLKFHGHENAEIVKTSHGSMPKKWRIKNLGDICTIIMGQSPSSKYYNEDGKGLPFHQGVSDFGEIFPVTKRYSTKGNRIAKRGDILFSVRAPVGRINFANTKMILGRGLCGIRSKTGDQIFLYGQLKRIFHEEDIMGGGTIFKAVTKKDMHDIKVICPNQALIDEFEARARPIFKQIEISSTINLTLGRLRDLVLPKLISGEIDVNRLDINALSD